MSRSISLSGLTGFQRDCDSRKGQVAWLIFLALLLFHSFGLASEGSDEVRLAPHRAVYELSLSGDDSGSLAQPAALNSMWGRMVYEIKGAPCVGYSITQRLVTASELSEGQRFLEDLQLSGFEDGEGRTFQFVFRRLIDQALRQSTSGYAKLETGATKLTLKEPAPEQLVLPHEVVFPAGFARKLVRAAKAGETFTSAYIFDGSEGAGDYFHATVSIGTRRNQATDDIFLRQFSTADRWPVTVAYYQAGQSIEGMAPLYEISTELFENGINGSLRLNFGAYMLEAKLVDLALLPQNACD